MKSRFAKALGAAAVIAGGVGIYAFGVGVPSPSDVPKDTPEAQAMVHVNLPAQLSAPAQKGQLAYEATCMACHGPHGAGVNGSGPPLVHIIYEPSHHGDMSFLMAVQNGVVSHHWPFGNMPAQTHVSPAQTAQIVAYIRELQRANGIH